MKLHAQFMSMCSLWAEHQIDSPSDLPQVKAISEHYTVLKEG